MFSCSIGCIVQDTVMLDDVLGKGGGRPWVAWLRWAGFPHQAVALVVGAGVGLVVCCRGLAQVPVVRLAAQWLSGEGDTQVDPPK